MSIPPLDPLYGCWWLAAGVVAFAAIALFVGAAYPHEEFDPADSWEGRGAEDTTPSSKEVHL